MKKKSVIINESFTQKLFIEINRGAVTSKNVNAHLSIDCRWGIHIRVINLIYHALYELIKLK